MPTRFLLQLAAACAVFLAVPRLAHALPPCTGPGSTGICSCDIACNSRCQQNGSPTTCGQINRCSGHCKGASVRSPAEALLAGPVTERARVCTAGDDDFARDDEGGCVDRAAAEPAHSTPARPTSQVATAR